MNLIEMLGGYEKARRIAECKSGVFHPTRQLLAALLEYRREHRIFEEGDKVVFVDDFMHGEIMTVAWTRKGEVWMDDGAKRCTDLSMIRHATDAEIKAGHRL